MARVGTRRALLGAAGGPREVVLPQYLLSSTGAEIEGFDSAAAWTVAGGVAADNSTAGEFRTGASSIKLTTAVSTNSTMTKSFAAAQTFPDITQHLRLNLFLYNDWTTTFSLLRFYLFTAGYAKNLEFVWNSASGQDIMHAGWNTIDIYPDQWSGTASLTTDTFTMLRMRLEPKAGAACSMGYDSLRAGLTSVPAIMWTFDDSDTSIYTNAYPILKANRARATRYIITSLVGADGFVSAAQLLQLEADGWSIGNHTRSHVYDLSDEDELADIQNGRDDLLGFGLTTGVNHFSWPGGKFTDGYLTQATTAGVLTARGINEKCYVAVDGYGDQLLTLPLTKGATGATPLATYTGKIDGAVTYKRPIVFYCHSVRDGGDISIANFQSVVDYAVARQVPFITAIDLHNALSGPVTVSLA